MQPRMTQVPPTRLSSHTATRAPSAAAMRLARTPPEPAPITKRSKSYCAMLCSRCAKASAYLINWWGETPFALCRALVPTLNGTHELNSSRLCVVEDAYVPELRNLHSGQPQRTSPHFFRLCIRCSQ